MGEDRTTPNERRALSPLALGAIAFGVALVVRLVYVCGYHSPEGFVFSDMWIYDYRAHNLLSGDTSAWDTFTPVGYPALLAAIYSLGGGPAVVGVLQALLGALSAGLLCALTRRCLPERPSLALGVGLVCALHLPAVLYAGYLLTETLFAFLIVSACWLLALALASGSRASRIGLAALLGLVLGGAAAVRPNLLLFMPVVPLLAWLACERRWWPALLASAVVFALFALPVGAVAVHNSRLLGRPASLGTNGGLNFYLNFAEVRGVRYSDRRGTHRITPIPNLIRYPRDEDEEGVRVAFYDDAHYYARGLALLRERPARLLNGLRNMVEAAGIGAQGYWPEPDTRLTRFHRRVFFGAALLPSIAGMLLLGARRRWAERARLPLLAAAALLLSNLVTVVFFLGDPRMRVPFDPLIVLLAAAGYLWLGDAAQDIWAPLLARWRAREPRAARRPNPP